MFVCSSTPHFPLKENLAINIWQCCVLSARCAAETWCNWVEGANKAKQKPAFGVCSGVFSTLKKLLSHSICVRAEVWLPQMRRAPLPTWDEEQPQGCRDTTNTFVAFHWCVLVYYLNFYCFTIHLSVSVGLGLMVCQISNLRHPVGCQVALHRLIISRLV